MSSTLIEADIEDSVTVWSDMNEQHADLKLSNDRWTDEGNHTDRPPDMDIMSKGEQR